jgi:uncharacterized membrane protein (UPF0127 family)
MKILNKTKNSIISENPLLADNFLSRLRGLMFRLRFPRTMLFVFPETSPKRNAIHSFFVFFEFDAVYLDEGKKVVDIYEKVKPFTPYIEPKKPAKYLLELEAGAVKKMKIELADQIEF